MSPVVASLQNGDAVDLKRKRAEEEEAGAGPVAKQPVHQPSNANTFDNDKAETWRENLRCAVGLRVGGTPLAAPGGSAAGGRRHQPQGCCTVMLRTPAGCDHSCLRMFSLWEAENLSLKAVLGRGVPLVLRPHACPPFRVSCMRPAALPHPGCKSPLPSHPPLPPTGAMRSL